MLKTFNVFNGDQIDNLPERFKPVKIPTKPMSIPRVEDFVSEECGAHLQVDVHHAACYVPAMDVIMMPTSEQFVSPEAWASTLLHELTHWTATKDRCDRGNMSTDKSSIEYAREELVAELGACFMCFDLGIVSTPRKESAAYLQSWLKQFKSDPNFLFEAYADANKAAKWCRDRAAAAVTA